MTNQELQEAINSLLQLAEIRDEALAFAFLHTLLAEQVRRATGGKCDYVPLLYNLSNAE